MKDYNYCQGCTTCCKWAGQKEVQVRLEPEEIGHFKTDPDNPDLLRTKKNGDCIYLEEYGCGIHERSPINCRAFDCRELLKEVMADKTNVFIRTLVEAVRLRLLEAIPVEEKPRIIVKPH